MSENEIKDAYKNLQKEQKVIDTTHKIKVGIIGTGWIAEAHVVELKRMPDVDIVAMADLVPGKAEAFAKQHGVENVHFYESHSALLANEELDLVNICTYNCTHAKCAIAALEKGVNVILEKPMCVTLEEAKAILEAEKKSGKILSIGFQPRFDPNMQQIKEIVQSGALGKIYYIQTGGGRREGIPFPFGTSFFAKETAGIGAMADIGCYSLDMVLNAVGYPKPLTISGYTSAFFGQSKEYSGYIKSAHTEYADAFAVEDFAAGFVRLEGDIMLDFRISWAMHMDSLGDTVILGTKAGLKIPSAECYNGGFDRPLKLFHTIGGNLLETDIPLSTKEPQAFYEKIRSVVDAIKEGGVSPISSTQIFYNQAIINGIIDSAKQSKEVVMDLPDLDML